MAQWSLPDWSLELPAPGRKRAEAPADWQIVVPPSCWMATELVSALASLGGGSGPPAGVLLTNTGCHVDWADACSSGSRSAQAALVRAAIEAAGVADTLPPNTGLLWVVACGSYAGCGPGLSWEGRLRRLQRSRVAYEEASAMLSTLGGGHFLCRHLPQAEALALAQQRLALSVGDSRQALRCGVHLCYAAMAAGDPHRAAWRLCGAAALGVRLGLLGRERAAAVCAEATLAVRAAGWLPGGYLAAETAAAAEAVTGGGGENCGARSGAGSAMAPVAAPADAEGGGHAAGAAAVAAAAAAAGAAAAAAAPHSGEHDARTPLAGGHAVLSTLRQRWPGDVGGAAGEAAPRTAPPAGELAGMVASAAAYIRSVGTWLAEEQRSHQRSEDAAAAAGDDFSRQRPGVKRWQPPVVAPA